MQVAGQVDVGLGHGVASSQNNCEVPTETYTRPCCATDGARVNGAREQAPDHESASWSCFSAFPENHFFGFLDGDGASGD